VKILYHHRIRGIDGQAVHVGELQKALSEEGHEVREVALVSLTEASPVTARGDTRQAAPGAQAWPTPWRWVRSLPRPLLELAELGYSLVAARKIARAGKGFGPDFIYERYAFGNAGGIRAARRLGVPLVLEVNSPLADELDRTRGLAFPHLGRRIERHVLSNADCVCAVSEVLTEMLLASGVRCERVLLTRNGVDAELFRPRPEARRAARQRLGVGSRAGDGALVLGFTGFPRSWHRLDLAVSSLTRPELAEAVVVVVGEGPNQPVIQRLAGELGVADRVLFPGPCPHAAIPELLAGFDVALLPGITPYSSPLKLLEYMAAGLPVVAPDLANLREVVTHRRDALLFEPGQQDAFVAALTELAGAPGLRVALGANARATILERNLTWQSNARRIVEFVARLKAA
jgi:glycosyltransferase involved in cell wall biosynthesis